MDLRWIQHFAGIYLIRRNIYQRRDSSHIAVLYFAKILNPARHVGEINNTFNPSHWNKLARSSLSRALALTREHSIGRRKRREGREGRAQELAYSHFLLFERAKARISMAAFNRRALTKGKDIEANNSIRAFINRDQIRSSVSFI